MNRKIVVLLIVCLLLAACASLKNDSEPPSLSKQDVSPAVEYEKPIYQFEPSYFVEKEFYGEDGTGEKVAYYTYQLHTLTVYNLDNVSPEDAEAATRNMEAFNAKMGSLLDDFVEYGQAMGDDIVSILYGLGSPLAPFYDIVKSDCFQAGDIISVRLSNSSYGGGAHPNLYISTYLFDLGTGQFIDATQLAEDPEVFQSGVADLLVEKAGEYEYQDAFWTDYADIFSRWNEGAVLFDEDGMQVIYSPYDLGPYVLGTVELRLSYDELSDLLGQSGLERLGLQTGTAKNE